MITCFKHFRTVISKEEDKQDAQKIGPYVYFQNVHVLEDNCCIVFQMNSFFLHQFLSKNGCISMEVKLKKKLFYVKLKKNIELKILF